MLSHSMATNPFIDKRKLKGAEREKRYGGIPEAHPESMRIKVLNAIAQGAPVSKIAREYGLSRTTVYRWMGKYQKTAVKGKKGPKTKSTRKSTRQKEDEEAVSMVNKLAVESLSDAERKVLLKAKQGKLSAQEERVLNAIITENRDPGDRYQAYAASKLMKLFRDAVEKVALPKTVKELDTLDQMIRRNLGVTDAKNSDRTARLRVDVAVLGNPTIRPTTENDYIDAEIVKAEFPEEQADTPEELPEEQADTPEEQADTT